MLVGSTMQGVFAEKSFRPKNTKTDSAVLAEKENKCPWFVRIFLLYPLDTKTGLDPTNAEFFLYSTFVRHLLLIILVQLYAGCVFDGRRMTNLIVHSITIHHRMEQLRLKSVM